MLASKAGAYQSEAPFKCSTLWWALGLLHKHYISLETRLRQAVLVNYDHKKFYNITNRAPSDCLQYYTGASGSFNSFNYAGALMLQSMSQYFKTFLSVIYEFLK